MRELDLTSVRFGDAGAGALLRARLGGLEVLRGYRFGLSGPVLARLKKQFGPRVGFHPGGWGKG